MNPEYFLVHLRKVVVVSPKGVGLAIFSKSFGIIARDVGLVSVRFQPRELYFVCLNSKRLFG